MSESAEGKPKSSLTPFQKVLSFLAPLILISLLTILLLPLLQQYDKEVELTYGIDITETTGSLMNRNLIFTHRDGTELKCPMPSKSDLESFASMECKDRSGAVRIIEPRRPV